MSEKIPTPRETRHPWRRFFRVCLIVLAVLLLARFVWTLFTSRDLHRAEQAVTDAAEPLVLSEVPRPAVTAADDGWPLYKQLIERSSAAGAGVIDALSRKANAAPLTQAEQAALDRDKADEDLLRRLSTGELFRHGGPASQPATAGTASAEDELRARLEARAELVTLLRLASARPGVAFPLSNDPLSPVGADLEPLFRLVQFTQAEALIAAADGRGEQALEAVGTLLRVGNQLAGLTTYEGRILEGFAAGFACDALQDILPKVRPAGGQRTLLHNLLRGGTTPEKLRATALHSRAVYHTLYQKLADAQLSFDALAGKPNRTGWWTSLKHWALRPFMQSSETYNLTRVAELLPLLSRPYAEAGAPLDAFEARLKGEAEGFSGVTHQWGVWHGFRLLEIARTTTLTRAMRQMASTALALRAFQVDNGNWPEKLEELLPRYLPELPIDPFTGKAIGYLPKAPAPRLYCAGLDRADNAGLYDGQDRAGAKGHDLCFFLTGVPADARPTPASAPSGAGK